MDRIITLRTTVYKTVLLPQCLLPGVLNYPHFLRIQVK